MESCGINHHFSNPEYFGLHISERGRSSYTFVENIKWISAFPLISVITGIFKCMYTFCLSIPGKVEKEEKKKKEKVERRAKAILGPNSRLFEEIVKRLPEAERKGVFNNQEEKKEHHEPEPEPCTRCGRKGHEESMCQFCYESVQAWKKREKGQWKPKQEKKEAASEEKPATSSEVGTSQGKLAVVYINDQTALHSPVWINGVKLTRCSIDSGS